MEKPYFETIASNQSDIQTHDSFLGFVAGCEYVWRTHVVPLQEKAKELEKANENQRQTITVQAEGIRNTGYIFSRICADNGEHSHWTVIRMSDGAKVWSENPEECKAMGHPVELYEAFEKMESENKLLRGENKHLISKYVNLDEINVTTYASHTKEELIKELNYYQNVVCAAKDNTNGMLLEEIERLKAELNFKQGCIDAKKLDV